VPTPPEQPFWAVLDHCSPSDRAFLSDRIDEYNVETTGVDDGRELAIILKDPPERIIAGVYGWTWGGFCEIESLWVERAYRHRGWGTRLLQAAEREARGRGARQIGLDTHSFQAPRFYEALGYSVFGTQDDYPIGHAHLFLSKRL
jgi:ribosomal protein S18 acetylase RimI-like enzyme